MSLRVANDAKGTLIEPPNQLPINARDLPDARFGEAGGAGHGGLRAFDNPIEGGRWRLRAIGYGNRIFFCL